MWPALSVVQVPHWTYDNWVAVSGVRVHECGSVRLTYVKHRIFDEMEAIGVDGSVLSIEDTLNESLNVEISTSHDEEEESRSMFNIYIVYER